MKRGIFLVFLIAASILFVSLPSISAQIIHDTPVGKTINVVSNETFVLAYKMEWNDPENPGFFIVTVYWDVPTNASHLNFTYIDFVCNFTDGTPVPGVHLSYYTANPGPGFMRYSLQHIQDSGVDEDSAFWLNVTMRAAGVVNGSYVPHAGGDQTIRLSPGVRCRELIEVTASGKCTIHVTPRILSCDSTGTPKDTFNYTEKVYVKGHGFNSNATIRLYVVQNTTWTEGKPIGTDVRGAYSTADVNPAGTMPAADLGILPIGEYDIVADANNNTFYNATEGDDVDDATSTPGVIVVGVHDVALISVTPSATVVNQGLALNITVLAKNEGAYIESFNVTAYYGNATGNYTIERRLVTNLAAGMEKSINLTWDTTPVSPGFYTILAKASIVPSEVDTADNIKVDGSVAVFVRKLELATLYKVKLTLYEIFDYGTNLTVKFYSYHGVYQGEVSVWNKTVSTLVILSMNVSHPLDLPIENATLVLTDSAGTILRTVTTFLVHRFDLFGRLIQIEARWSSASEERTKLFKEMVEIDMQWPYAPP